MVPGDQMFLRPFFKSNKLQFVSDKKKHQYSIHVSTHWPLTWCDHQVELQKGSPFLQEKTGTQQVEKETNLVQSCALDR